MGADIRWVDLQLWNRVWARTGQGHEDLWYEASGSGRAEPKTRTDSEAKTQKSRLQVQVDSHESLPSKLRI